MRLYEFEGKKLLESAGVPLAPLIQVQGGEEISERVREAADKIGPPVILKVQILRGARGKAGGIRLATSAAEAGEIASQLINSEFYGLRPDSLLVEKALDIEREYYLGITIDEVAKENVLILSEAGGMEVEEAAKS